MNRATCIFRLMTLALLAAPAASAEDLSGLEAYLAAVSRAEQRTEADCQKVQSTILPEGRVWLKRGPNGLEIVPQDARAAEAAAFWASVVLGAEDIARRLYGRVVTDDADADPIMIETTDGIATVHGGMQLARGDACDALRGLIGGMGGIQGGNPFNAARDAATDTTRVTLAIGGVAEAPITATLPADAIVRGPDGVTAGLEAGEDGPLIRIEARADATPGEATVRVYDPNDRFTPLETIDLSILPGAAPAEQGAETTIFAGDRHEGILPVGRSQRVALTLQNGERVTFTSSDDTDLRATLESEDGRIIAADDDSGPGYGFTLKADLAPGRYFLILSHCCGGGGRFAVTRANR